MLTVLTTLALIVLLGLGTWQVHRLKWKTELIERATARLDEPALDLAAPHPPWPELDYRHGRAIGQPLTDSTMIVGTEGRSGRFGGRLLLPLQLPDGGIFAVDLGWVADDAPVAALVARLPPGPLTVEGILRYRGPDGPGPLAPTPQPDQRRWYAWDMPSMAGAIGHPLLPVVLTVAAPVLGADGPQPVPVSVDYPNNHLGYAITWYGLAAGLIAVYVALGRKRARG